MCSVHRPGCTIVAMVGSQSSAVTGMQGLWVLPWAQPFLRVPQLKYHNPNQRPPEEVRRDGFLVSLRVLKPPVS